MKKIFLLFAIIACCNNLFAQIAQTFVPEVGKTYYIKPATNAQAAYRQCLIDDNGTLKFNKMDGTTAKATANAQWEIQYVTDNGYILKNKSTESYVTNAVNATSALDENKCLFELRVANDFYLGNTFQTKSYGIIIAGDGNGFDLSITENSSTVNKWSYGSGDNNRRFLIVPEDKIDNFEETVTSGETYYIKSLSERTGVRAGYVSEGAGAKITIIPAADAADNLKAQWETVYVEGEGYTLKNKETGHYFTTVSTDNVRDAVDLSSSTASSYYTISYSPKTYKQGKYDYDSGAYIDATFGGVYIKPATASGSMNAYGNDFFGLWNSDKSDGGSTDNSFTFQRVSEAKFTSGVTANAFTPVADTKYYIKSAWWELAWGKTQDDMVDVYVADNEGVVLETITSDNIKTSEIAQWYITYNETDGGYYFQNVGTGKYVKINNDDNKTLSMTEKDDVNSFLFNVALYDSSNPVYTYTNTTTGNSFTSVSYHLINKFYNREFDLNRSQFAIGTWSPEDGVWKRWMILTEAELKELIDVKNGVITSAPAISSDQISVYSSGNVIYVNSAEAVLGVSVYNMQGQLLYSGTNTTIDGVSTGICIVKIATKNGISNHKLLVK